VYFRGFSDADPAAVLDSVQVMNKSIVRVKLRVFEALSQTSPPKTITRKRQIDNLDYSGMQMHLVH